MMKLPLRARAVMGRLSAADWSVFAPDRGGLALALVVAAVSAPFLIGGRGAMAAAEYRWQLCSGVSGATPQGVQRFAVAAFAHMFLHVNWAHLAGNLVGLACAASAVHRRLRLGGAAPARALAVLAVMFAAGGVSGGLMFAVSNLLSPACMIGASGAVAGFFGAALRFVFRSPARVDADPLGLAPLSAGAMALVFGLALVDYLGSTLAAILRIYPLAAATEAHVGGLLFGLITFPMFLRLAGAK